MGHSRELIGVCVLGEGYWSGVWFKILECIDSPALSHRVLVNAASRKRSLG
jgi:hypothetical protein